MVRKRRLICQQLQRKRDVIYIDEVEFNQEILPIFGYSQIGKKASAKKRPKSENYSVVAAITKNYPLGFQIFKTNVAANEFEYFLITLLKAHPEIQENRNEFIIFVDNASFYKAVTI